MTSTEPISTDRLELTPLSVDDADAMAVVLASPELYEFTGGTPPTADQLRKTYGRQIQGPADPAEHWHNWIVRVDGDPVGYVQATVTEHEADIAWVIGIHAQGNGYASEAARAMVHWLVDNGTRTITAHVHPDHHASNGVARRLGLRPTGDLVDGERRWELRTPSTADG